jgi:hypothetical protein
MITRPVKRLFAFGCSFTKYFWSCWPEIVGEDLDIPFYNYGQSGAGNQFIANMVAQADAIHRFNADDLIMICWTNVCREDKWHNGQWATPGNIYTQNIYNSDYVEKWADPLGYLIRDAATMTLTKGYLQNINCQHHFFSMCELQDHFDLNEKHGVPENVRNHYIQICEMYKEILDMPSFFNVLWHNDIHLHKFKPQKLLFDSYFDDGHATPLDHLDFLKLMFPNHQFKNSTIEKVQLSNTNLNNFIHNQIKTLKRRFAIYELPDDVLKVLLKESLIKQAEPHTIV